MFSVEATFRQLSCSLFLNSVCFALFLRWLNWLRHFFPGLPSFLLPLLLPLQTAICLPKVHFLTNLSNVTNEKICY